MNTSKLYNYLDVVAKRIFELKIVRYGIVGGISTVIHLMVASGYIYFINDSIFQSNILGFMFAYVFSYAMQSKYVFAKKKSKENAIKYFIVQFSSLLLAMLVTDMSLELNSYIKTGLIIVMLPIITFFAHKFYTFK